MRIVFLSKPRMRNSGNWFAGQVPEGCSDCQLALPSRCTSGQAGRGCYSYNDSEPDLFIYKIPKDMNAKKNEENKSKYWDLDKEYPTQKSRIIVVNKQAKLRDLGDEGEKLVKDILNGNNRCNR